MPLESSHVEHVIPSWCHSFERWQNLWGVGPNFRKQFTKGVPLMFMMTCFCLPSSSSAPIHPEVRRPILEILPTP